MQMTREKKRKTCLWISSIKDGGIHFAVPALRRLLRPVRQRLPGVSLILLATFMITGNSATASSDLQQVATLEEALVKVAAERVDATLSAVAESTQALAASYARLVATPQIADPLGEQQMLAGHKVLQNTLGLQSWPAGSGNPPESGAPYVALYSYNGATVNGTVRGELALLRRFAPNLRMAYESFPFSWVYITTTNNTFAIYPYVPIEEAVHNQIPTREIFYQAANFAERQVGWTPPYLDLVGAGMMVTASSPIYLGDLLLGVASRDITLKQLAHGVLGQIALNGRQVVLVDANGVAIYASDPDHAAELSRINLEAGGASLHYRTPEGLAALANPRATPSASTELNQIVEQLLAARISDSQSSLVRLELTGHRVLAASVATTGWLVVLIDRKDG